MIGRPTRPVNVLTSRPTQPVNFLKSRPTRPVDSLFESMITRQNTQKVIELLRELEWVEILHHPWYVLFDRWDCYHFHRLRELAEVQTCDLSSVLRGNVCQGNCGNPHKTNHPSLVPSIPGIMICMPNSGMILYAPITLAEETRLPQ